MFCAPVENHRFRRVGSLGKKPQVSLYCAHDQGASASAKSPKFWLLYGSPFEQKWEGRTRPELATQTVTEKCGEGDAYDSGPSGEYSESTGPPWSAQHEIREKQGFSLRKDAAQA